MVSEPQRTEPRSHSGIRPRCPLCPRYLVARFSKKNGRFFWACPNYPVCRGARRMPLRLQADYAQTKIGRRVLASDRRAKFHVQLVERLIDGKRVTVQRFDPKQPRLGGHPADTGRSLKPPPMEIPGNAGVTQVPPLPHAEP
jgi:ssDNA-binding Zn-finger/Zn-ribbon topoisomerase 1